jgi:DNA-binding NtrC family response regulator
VGYPKHILVVDDDGDVRNVVIEILREREYQVSSAVDGSSMREFLKKDGSIDAVVLDAVMPGEGSPVLALHARDLGLAVVMMSGSPELMQFATENGLQLLEKPFRAQQLVNALLKAFDGGELEQRPA